MGELHFSKGLPRVHPPRPTRRRFLLHLFGAILRPNARLPTTRTGRHKTGRGRGQRGGEGGDEWIGRREKSGKIFKVVLQAPGEVGSKGTPERKGTNAVVRKGKTGQRGISPSNQSTRVKKGTRWPGGEVKVREKSKGREGRVPSTTANGPVKKLKKWKKKEVGEKGRDCPPNEANASPTEDWRCRENKKDSHQVNLGTSCNEGGLSPKQTVWRESGRKLENWTRQQIVVLLVRFYLLGSWLLHQGDWLGGQVF